jgi:hypothetical protein
VIKSGRVRWVRDVACMGEKMHTKFWSENLKGRDLSEDLDVYMRIVPEWFIMK